MARKNKARLTHKKKTEKSVKSFPDQISTQSFAALAHQYGSFIMTGSDKERRTFLAGDVAYIQHQETEDDVGVPEQDYWIGKIEEIRGDNPDDVWVRVQWFWSPQEVAEVIKSFNPAICGKLEKLSSDNCDIVSVQAFIRHVDVKLFDEISIYQIPIGDDDWFSRYTFHYAQRRVSPKVTHEACMICKIPYIPGAQKILHFCPRPGCRKFYHQACLVKRNYVQTPLHRLLETWPSVDRTVAVETISASVRSDSEPPAKRQRRDPDCASGSDGDDTDPLANFPALLVAVADLPIVRGTPGGGVVGNITSVVAARELILKTLSEGGVVPHDWETAIDVSEAFLEADDFPDCFCPSCYSPI